MLQVNGVTISDEAIAREMQYHPASTVEEARFAAAQALALRETLRQACVNKGLCDELPTSPEEEEALFERLLDQEIQLPEINDEACRRYYENNLSRYCSSPLVEARHILLAAAPDDDEARKNAAQQAQVLIQSLINQTARFADVARSHSACTSREQEGHLGQLSKGSTVPEFEKVLFAAKPGLCGEPLFSRYGVHIVEVLHHEPGRQLPYDVVADRIAAELQLNARQHATVHYLHRLMAEQTISGLDS